jgi:hypothetical protein
MDAQTGEQRWGYRITVQGLLDESWSSWLGGMSISVDRAKDGVPVTTLTGSIVDQPALRGIVNRLWDLNLKLVSVERVWDDPPCEEANR